MSVRIDKGREWAAISNIVRSSSLGRETGAGALEVIGSSMSAPREGVMKGQREWKRVEEARGGVRAVADRRSRAVRLRSSSEGSRSTQCGRDPSRESFAQIEKTIYTYLELPCGPDSEN
ncbi:hypothetical protein B0H14DRAFT_2586754 [Mycena olivaceomarginata]|nr:hypothetical protein B0H14DRAFT_2586754 [Mycena olivaceomarginata]